MGDIRKLLASGADPNKLEDGISFLHRAISNDDPDLIAELLNKGADPTTKSYSANHPLIFAVEQGANRCLSAFLEHGINPNVSSQDGKTPLYSAVSLGNNEAMTLLLRNQADPNIPGPSGDIPLFEAIRKKNLSAVELLISHGSKTNVSSKVAIQLALSSESLEIVKSVLSASEEDIYIKDDNGNTALDEAAELSDPSFELLLLSSVLPSSCDGDEFVESLKSSIIEDSQTVCEQLTPEYSSDPERLTSLFNQMTAVEHRMTRFGELIEYKIKNAEDRLEALQGKAEDGASSEMEEALQRIAAIWKEELETSKAAQQNSEKNVFTEASLATVGRWRKAIQERERFLNDFLSASHEQQNSCYSEQEIDEMAKLKKQMETLKAFSGWEEEAIAPFRKKCLEFTKKMQRTLAPNAKDPGMSDVFEALNSFIGQVPSEPSPKKRAHKHTRE